MDIRKAILDLWKIVALWHNQTTVQRIGSVLTALIIVASIAQALLPQPGDTPVAPPAPAGDVLPVDAGNDAPDAPDASTGILEVIGAAIASPLGCSAAQQQIVKASAGDLAACLLQCGVGTASATIRSVAGGYEIDGPALGYSAIGCALPCLARFGTVAVSTYAAGGARWGGSAGEANAYVPDRIVVSIKAR